MRNQEKTTSPEVKSATDSFFRERIVNAEDNQPKEQMKSSISMQKRINPRLLIL